MIIVGRDKKNKPKKPKKYPSINTSRNLKDLNSILFFKSNRIDIPYGKSHGTDAEKEVISILQDSRIPPGLVLKPKLVKIPSIGENEISDGIILYGDTAFLLQIKSRNKEPEAGAEDFTAEVKKIESLISKAYKQTLDSLTYLEQQGEVIFENYEDESVTVRYSDYNWVALILINHAGLDEINSTKIVQSDNDTIKRKIPRVIMSFQDLEDMSNVFERVPFYILNYLRRLQYQPKHELGNDMRRFGNFVLEGIHDYSRFNFVIEFEKIILTLHGSNQISKEIAKDLLYGLDYMHIVALSNQQKSFASKFEKVSVQPLKDSFIMPQNDTGYVALFYNSQKTPSDVDIIWEANRAGQGFGERAIKEGAKIKRILAIAVDVSEINRQETVGVVLEIRGPRTN